MAPPGQLDTTTLNTKLEENFVSPLTAVRGVLEILRDFPDLEPSDHRRFVQSALDECARLERGIDELASAVYAAPRTVDEVRSEGALSGTLSPFSDRLQAHNDSGIIEVDFSGFEFSSVDVVNNFFDAIEAFVEPTARRWYFLTNFRNCRVWPEAWVAFAHRGKKIGVNYALGTVRYAESDSEASGEDPNICRSRDEALSKIATMKSACPG